MRKAKPKTRDELFKHILALWQDNERQCISEWCIGNRTVALADLDAEYQAYLKLWEQLKK